jgi:hypothetical protein
MEIPSALDIIRLLVLLKLNTKTQKKIEEFRTIIDILLKKPEIGLFKKS